MGLDILVTQSMNVHRKYSWEIYKEIIQANKEILAIINENFLTARYFDNWKVNMYENIIICYIYAIYFGNPESDIGKKIWWLLKKIYIQ